MGFVMMALLLVSMYFVFSTVADKFESEKEPDEKEAIEQLNKLLEDFEVITPEPSAANIENPSSKLVEMEDDLHLTDALAEKIRQEQDVSDKKRAQAALAESIKRGEANRLLEQVAEPLLEEAGPYGLKVICWMVKSSLILSIRWLNRFRDKCSKG